ncbi:MAG: endolytic transglycosylase MltG [Gammaproteobacteria bacterium]
MRSRVWLSLLTVIALVAAGGAATAFAWRTLNTAIALPAEGSWLEVENGMSLRRVATQLGERGVLAYPWLLTAYARATGDATRIRAGEYQLPSGTTPLSLLSRLVSGQVYLHQMTIVEGWRFTDLLRTLRSNPAIVAGALDGPGIMAALGEPGVHPEGQFFPDTYRFAKGTTELDVLRQAHQALLSHLEAAWQSRSPKSQVKSSYEALIMASIIEKETALPAERRLIAGVFHERLRRNMRLQTDPTVIYGLGEAFDGNLRRDDLERDTPYNTYTRGGLPPTPIALPGAGALEAAVMPEISGAVYFVATGRGDGSHHFSATLEEHDRAVRDYLRQLRNPER